MKKRIPQIVVGLIFTVLFTLHLLDKVELHVLNVLENLAYDTRINLTIKNGKDDRIVIIDIDEKTLREMGQWPWPRERITLLVDTLFDQYGISVLGFDMVFAEADSKSGIEKVKRAADKETNPTFKQKLFVLAESMNGDAILGKSFDNRNIVLGYYFNTDPSLKNSVGGLPEPVFEDDGFLNMTLYPVKATSYNANLHALQSHATTAGFFSGPLIDFDGVTRRVPLLHEYNGAIYESLALAVARVHLDEIIVPVFGDIEIEPGIPLMEAISIGEREIPMDTKGAIMIPFRGKAGSFPYISATDVINGNVKDNNILKGAIALLGTSAIGLADLRVTPVDPVYPGVEAHANIIAGLLDVEFKSKSPFAWVIEIGSVIALGLILSVTLPFLSPAIATVFSAIIFLTVIVVNIYFWQYKNSILPLATTLTTIFTIYIFSTIYKLFTETRHSKAVRKSFSSYLAPALVDQLIENPESLKLEGENRNMTFLFTDIANFTTFTEKTEARLLVNVLNEYLDHACQIIMEHGGTIDKMIGDAIVAIYNAPIVLPGHEQRAVQTALALDDFCTRFAREKQAQGIGIDLTRIGINTGNAVVGNFGGINRFDYTVVGDAVNAAARLESVNKYLGTRICVAGSTVAKCPDVHFRPIASLVLKGKSNAIETFEPLSKADYESERCQRYLEIYELIANGVPDALAKLTELKQSFPDDPLLSLHIKRLKHGENNVIITLDEK